MARALSAALDACMVSPVRQPAYRIDVYDLRSTAAELVPTRIGTVVLSLQGLAEVPEIVGPRSFGPDVASATLTETAGDFLEGGPTATLLELTVVDPSGALDPVTNPPTVADPEADGRWLRAGNVVVVREGDTRVSEDVWAITFCGRIQGQAGASGGRTEGTALLSVRAASREADYLRQLSTSREYVQTTPFTTIAQDIAETDMHLDQDEVVLPAFSVRTTAFASTQFAEESPLASLAKLMFPDAFMPRFRGDGRLTATSYSITKGATRTYSSSEPILSMTRPLQDKPGTNEVLLIGLDPAMSKVLQGRQTLATAQITTGFFSRKAKIPVAWSEDGRQQAQDVRMEVESSVADGVFNFGGESFAAGTPDADGGVTRGEIRVDGGLEASMALATLLAGAWIFSHAKPDGVVAFGTGTVTGFTKSIGRLIEGAIGQTLFGILGKVGRGQYRITGRPYEWVFQEIPRMARIEGVSEEERSQVKIENHLVNTAADCVAVAQRSLLRLRAQQKLRTLVMLHDLALEPFDLFATGSGSARRVYAITGIRRELSRAGNGTAQVEAFEVTAGVLA